MLTSLYNRLQENTQDLRVIILRSSGNVFSAGHDLREFVSDQCHCLEIS